MDKDFFGVPIVYYDWNKGMDCHKDGIMIWVDNKYVQLTDVQFYDSVRGFIQTATHFYMPIELKGKVDAN